MSQLNNGDIITAVSVIVSALGAVWWAATIQTKLDDIIKLFGAHLDRTNKMENQLAAIETRVTILESQK